MFEDERNQALDSIFPEQRGNVCKQYGKLRELSDLTPNVDARDMPRVQAPKRSFNEWFDLVLGWGAVNGGSHCPPVGCVFGGAKLGAWVSRMRGKYLVGELPPAKSGRLAALNGWQWSYGVWTREWVDKAVRFVELMETNGGTIPDRIEDKQLRVWYRAQLSLYNKMRGGASTLVAYWERFEWLNQKCNFMQQARARADRKREREREQAAIPNCDRKRKLAQVAAEKPVMVAARRVVGRLSGVPVVPASAVVCVTAICQAPGPVRASEPEIDYDAMASMTERQQMMYLKRITAGM